MKLTNKARSQQKSSEVAKTAPVSKSDNSIKRKITMSSELISPENVSKELLKSFYDNAFMETSYDSENDLRVKDTISCWVFISTKKDRINLVSQFGFTKNSNLLERLEAVNKMNLDYAIIKAMVAPNDNLRFSYDIFIGGGVTDKDIVLATKTFLSIPLPAVADDAKNIVE